MSTAYQGFGVVLIRRMIMKMGISKSTLYDVASLVAPALVWLSVCSDRFKNLLAAVPVRKG